MAQGLRSLGHETQVWQYGDSGFAFPADRTIEQSQDPRHYLDLLNEAIEEDFDVVHFHYGRSLVPATCDLPWLWDLPVWRALGKRIVFTFHGSDVRLRSHHLENDEWSHYRFADVPCDEEQIAAKLTLIRAYADAMTVGTVLNLPYVPEATYVPRVVDVSAIPFAGPANRDTPVVLHAPSRRSIKGTDFILAGLEELRTRGVDFRVDLVEGVPHGELMERCAAADVVIEKVLGGDPGISSLEAMAMGKVAVTRIREQVAESSPGLPVVSADPTTFADVMESLLTDPDRRAALGRAGRAYVETHHDSKVVAQHLLRLYQGTPRARPAMTPGWTAPDLRRRLDVAREQVAMKAQESAVLKQKLAKSRQRRRTLQQELADLREQQRSPTPQGPLGRWRRSGG